MTRSPERSALGTVSDQVSVRVPALARGPGQGLASEPVPELALERGPHRGEGTAS